MQSAHWINLLRRLPAEVHNQISVVTLGGTEVMVQTILQMDSECLIIKGRLAACQDTGRVFFIPFDQIDYVGFIRLVTDDEFRTWFGDTPLPTVDAVPVAPVAANGVPVDPAQANGAAGKNGNPSRAALLERVRARTTTPGLTLNGISLPAPPPTSM